MYDVSRLDSHLLAQIWLGTLPGSSAITALKAPTGSVNIGGIPGEFPREPSPLANITEKSHPYVRRVDQSADLL